MTQHNQHHTRIELTHSIHPHQRNTNSGDSIQSTSMSQSKGGKGLERKGSSITTTIVIRHCHCHFQSQPDPQGKPAYPRTHLYSGPNQITHVSQAFHRSNISQHTHREPSIAYSLLHPSQGKNDKGSRGVPHLYACINLKQQESVKHQPSSNKSNPTPPVVTPLSSPCLNHKLQHQISKIKIERESQSRERGEGVWKRR